MVVVLDEEGGLGGGQEWAGIGVGDVADGKANMGRL